MELANEVVCLHHLYVVIIEDATFSKEAGDFITQAMN